MIYLDNAATTSPKPDTVVREVDRALRLYSANPGRGGHTPSVTTAKAVYNVRKSVKDFFHVKSEEDVIFTSGCTQALNIVIKGTLKRGDHVVISSMEHNAVLRPLHQLKEQGKINYTIADVVAGDNDATVNAFRNAINEHTRMIICTHASNVFGVRLPVERICALAHNYGILFCLDAAQSAGIFDVNLSDNGYDYVCCAGHKSLYGPMGTGLLLLGNDIRLEPLTAGGTGSDSANPLMPEYYPDRLESGTLNIPGICGLGTGIRFVNTRGRENIARHEMRLVQHLYRELSRTDKVMLYTPAPEIDEYAPVLSFNIEGSDSEAVSAFLNRRYGIAVRAGLHCAPLAHKAFGTLESGAVRIAPSAFSTERDIEILLKAVKNFIHTT